MDQAAIEATLRFLAPGFVAIKVFSQFGLRSKRSDLELTVWSVVAAWALNLLVAIPGPFASINVNVRLLTALALAGIFGFAFAWAWRQVWQRSYRARAAVSSRVWNFAFVRSNGEGTPWIQVWLSDGHILFGWPQTWSLDGEADQPDLLLADPEWVDVLTQERTRMTGVGTVLIASSEILMVQFLDVTHSDDVNRRAATSAVPGGSRISAG
jgi:hypothetical protein